MIPFIQDSVIHFEQGTIDIDRCTVKDLKVLFGPPALAKGEGNKNEMLFLWDLGAIIAFSHPEEEFSDQSSVLLLHVILDNEILLDDLMRHYRCRPVSYFVDDESGRQYNAIFSLRFQVQFQPQNNEVSLLSFVNQGHVSTCSCQECTLIREQVKYISPFEPRPARMNVPRPKNG